MSLEDKEINVWENNKIDTDIINVAVKSSFLLNKMEKTHLKMMLIIIKIMVRKI